VDLSIITSEILMGTQITSAEELDMLKRLGVGGLLCLQDDSDFRRLGLRWEVLRTLGAERGIDMRRVAVVDFDPADLLEKLDTAVGEVADLLQENKRVYVHCTAGINRSSGVVISYLVLKQGHGVQAAYRMVKGQRPQASPYRRLLDELGERRRRELAHRGA
jgi:protein-tyrosine phosphatase